MPFVQFLRDYDGHFTGNVVDLRLAYAEALVRQDIARWADPDTNSLVFEVGSDGYVPKPTVSDVANMKVLAADGTWITTSGDMIVNFSQDTDGTVVGPTLAEINANKILQADNTWITAPTSFDFVGTAGSVIFAGASGELAEDNDKFFFDDASDELGINIGIDPLATLHIGRDVSTGNIFRAVRSGTGVTAEAFFFGPSGSTADLMITGDGRVGINNAEATINAQLRVSSSSASLAACVVVDANATGSVVGLLIDHEGATGDAMDVSSAVTTAYGLDLQCDALTTGKIAYFRSSSSSASTRTLVDIYNGNSAATGATPLVCTNLAAGLLARLNYSASATDVAFSVATTGHIATRCDQTTDTAPNDDTTQKKISLQRLTSAPVNAMYLQLSNPPGGTADFFLVIEEG